VDRAFDIDIVPVGYCSNRLLLLRGKQRSLTTLTKDKQPGAPARILTSNPSSQTDADIKVLNRSATGTGYCVTNMTEIRVFVQQKF